MSNLFIEEKVNSFSYITFKLQASMYNTDQNFLDLKKSVKGISSFILAYTNASPELLLRARLGMTEGFNKLKKEEKIPIFS
ncbi:MAG TPA: hypothetical protein EYO73_03830 [Sulfurimonas sp.]|nr:hypothetical protein [Sulfurimonas sp.]